MAKIYLEGKEAPFASSPFGHLYLVLDGSGVERVIRGGPAGVVAVLGIEPTGFNIDIPLSLTLDARDGTQRGRIVLDLDGRDAEHVWELMVQHARENVEANGYRYFPTIQNSNSVIGSALNVAGFDVNQLVSNAVFNFIEGGFPAAGNFLNFDYTLRSTDGDDIIIAGLPALLSVGDKIGDAPADGPDTRPEAGQELRLEIYGGAGNDWLITGLAA